MALSKVEGTMAENSTTLKPYYIYIVSVRIQKTPENTICHLFRCYAPKVNHLVMMQLCPEFTSFNQKLWGFVFLDYSWSCLSSKKCFQLCKHDQNSELSKNWMMPCYDLFSNGSDVNELWKQKHSNLESRFKLAILSRDLSVCGSHQYFIIQCFTFTGWINTLIGHVTSLILALILGSIYIFLWHYNYPPIITQQLADFRCFSGQNSDHNVNLILLTYILEKPGVHLLFWPKKKVNDNRFSVRNTRWTPNSSRISEVR